MNCRAYKGRIPDRATRLPRTAERHQLRFDALQLRQCAHGEKHFVEQSPSDGFLIAIAGKHTSRRSGPCAPPARKSIANGNAFVDGDAAGKGVGVQEALDEIQGAAVIPMEFFAPMASFFQQQRLELRTVVWRRSTMFMERSGLAPLSAFAIIADSSTCRQTGSNDRIRIGHMGEKWKRERLESAC